MSVHTLIVARQQLGKDVPAAMKNCWKSFSMRSVSYEMKGGDYVFPEHVPSYLLK
jgi:hypothetical protein